MREGVAVRGGRRISTLLAVFLLVAGALGAEPIDIQDELTKDLPDRAGLTREERDRVPPPPAASPAPVPDWKSALPEIRKARLERDAATIGVLGLAGLVTGGVLAAAAWGQDTPPFSANPGKADVLVWTGGFTALLGIAGLYGAWVTAAEAAEIVIQ